MPTKSTAFARVRAFIADWTAARQEIADDHEPSTEHERWREALHEIYESHCIDGAFAASAATFPSEPTPHSLAEMIADQILESDRATIQTKKASDHQYNEYELVSVDGDWRIAKLNSFPGRRGPLRGSPPLIPESERAQILSAASSAAPFGPMREDDAEVNEDRPFEPGRKIASVKNSEETAVIEVRAIGILRTSSGILAANDPYFCDRSAALSHRLPPGEYPISIAVAHHVVLALRVQIGTVRPTVRWSPEGEVGVDSGMAGIFDLASALQLTVCAKEEFADRIAAADPFLVTTMIDQDDCVVVRSGAGDGSYPCYWGVDASGAPTVLQIDFIRVP